MRERKILIVALATTMVCGPTATVSADGPSSFQTNWSGPYFGVYAGRAWADADLRTDTGSVTATSYFTSAANIDSVNQNASGSLSPTATIGGVQIGVNDRHGDVVTGLEADFGFLNLNGSRGASNVPYPTFPAAQYTVRTSFDTDWMLTVRARIGWMPRPTMLIYATGGLAVTNLEVTNSFSDNGPEEGVGGGRSSETRVGWTLGGGAEWLLTKSWTVKAEYLYVDFGSTSVHSSIDCGPAKAAACAVAGVTPNPFSTSADLSAHIARIGLNYAF